MKMKATFKRTAVLAILIISAYIGISVLLSTVTHHENKANKAAVSTDSLKTLVPGDLFMDVDGVLFCVKNNVQTARAIICYDLYGRKKHIFLNTPTAKKIVKIVKKDDPEYCETAKKFLSTY
jgi:hypothetical protein